MAYGVVKCALCVVVFVILNPFGLVVGLLSYRLYHSAGIGRQPYISSLCPCVNVMLSTSIYTLCRISISRTCSCVNFISRSFRFWLFCLRLNICPIYKVCKLFIIFLLYCIFHFSFVTC